MSQYSTEVSDDDDDDCEYFLQPTNQYNITEKVKEANQQLYKGEAVQRQTVTKVRFKDHLVDYEPEDESEVMEKKENENVGSVKSEEEYSEEEEITDATVVMVETESIEIEEVCEQIELFDPVEKLEDDAMEDENYSKDFEDEDENSQEGVIALNNGDDGSEAIKERKKRPPRKNKVTPADDEIQAPNDQDEIIVEGCKTRKACCQFKETDEYKQKLPKYNGLNSNYGLSKDEIAKRELTQRKKMEHVQFKETFHMEQKEFLAKTNEEAFAKWLHKKMRDPVNKSNPTNMFDVKASSKKRQRRCPPFQRQKETDEGDEDYIE